MTYAELDTTSNFSFLEGASHPQELVAQAKALGLSAIAIADRNTLAGVVRAHVAAKAAGLQFIPGARLDLVDAPSLICLPTDRAAYGRLTRLLSLGQGRAQKGQCHLKLADVAAHAEGQIFIIKPPSAWHLRPEHGRLGKDEPSGKISAFEEPVCATALLSTGSPSPVSLPTDTISTSDLTASIIRVADTLGRTRVNLAATCLLTGDDSRRLATLATIAHTAGIPLVATNAARFHAAHRRQLSDVVTCIRYGLRISDAGFAIAANAERHLKS
ncbi:MAG: PHP domain-containing protein, partial [Hyphomicrobium aestuarii]|nr:PHP domain-containing protein [Hyphomicrobium aestuarii]